MKQNYEIDTDDSALDLVGAKLAEVLNLQESFDSDEYSRRYVTSGGTKTHKGLALTVLRILQNDY